MTQFVSNTLSDLRGGRETWRVRLTITVTSFVVAFGTALLRLAS